MNASVRLLQQVLPATVGVNATIRAEHASVPILGTERHGSGVLVEDGTLVLTVNYVVLGAQSVQVLLFDESVAEGTVVAQDFATGIAVVRIPEAGPHALRMRSSAGVQTGTDVFIAAAVAEGQRRVSDGVISSLARFDAHWEYSLERALVTTAMNPGLGGAPLIDVYGRVLGVVSLDLGEVGRLTMAIPAEHYIENGAELLQHGRRVSRPLRAWIGLYCYNFKEHVVIAGLLPGTPGEKAGLRAGDVVLAVNGRPVSGRHELYSVLWDHRPGEALDFRLFRGNQVTELEVTSGDAERFFA